MSDLTPRRSDEPGLGGLAGSAASSRPALSPFCRHLASKKLVFRTSPPQTEEDVLDASRHCWCKRTQQALGPDGEVVATDECKSFRSCFEGF